MRKHTMLLVLVFAVSIPVPAFAWGNVGHEIIGSVAQRRLSTPARNRALALLRSDTGCPASPATRNFGQVATLPDDFRNREGGQVTRDWHFVNIDIANPAYVESRDCPSGDCVNRRIDRMVEMLNDPSKSRCQKKDALIYLTHFVGDLHQPFHCGFGRLPNGAPDLGGNLVDVIINNRRNNLHSVWDSTLISLQGRNNDAWVNHIANDVIPTLDAGKLAELRSAEWVNESHRIAIDQHVADGTTLDQDYIDESTPIIDEQLALAAVRLANLVEEALGN